MKFILGPALAGSEPGARTYGRDDGAKNMKMNKNKKNRKCQEGQELVEYAIALPIMLLFLMSILDLGRAVYAYSALHNSVRDGARYGVIYPTDAVGIESVVRVKAVGLNPAELTVFVVQPDPDTIQVRATYEFLAVTPIVGTLVGSNQWVIGSQATMRVEG